MTTPTPNNFDRDQHLLDADQAIQRVIEEEMRQHQESIRELGHPDWCFAVFQQMCILLKEVSQARPTEIKSDDISSRLQQIISKFPKSFFDLNEKCETEFEAACRELKDYIEQNHMTEAEHHQ